jgi:hypothetical protein
VPGRWYEEALEPSSEAARVVARFASGAPAAVASSYGQGRSLMLGSYVSAGFVSQPEETTRRFYAGLLDWAGVAHPVGVSGDPVEVRLIESGRDHLVFVFNHAEAPAAATLRMRVPLAGRSVQDLVSGDAVSVTAVADGFEWRATLPALDVRVLHVRGQVLN